MAEQTGVPGRSLTGSKEGHRSRPAGSPVSPSSRSTGSLYATSSGEFVGPRLPPIDRHHIFDAGECAKPSGLPVEDFGPTSRPLASRLSFLRVSNGTISATAPSSSMFWCFVQFSSCGTPAAPHPRNCIIPAIVPAAYRDFGVGRSSNWATRVSPLMANDTSSRPA